MISVIWDHHVNLMNHLSIYIMCSIVKLYTLNDDDSFVVHNTRCNSIG